MIDRQLLSLLGRDKKYILYAVCLMTIGLMANIATIGCICYAIWLLCQKAAPSSFLIVGGIAIICIAARHACACAAGDMREIIGRNVKRNLREKLYSKILDCGENSTEDLGMAGLTQVSIEGIEQLDLYFSYYLPQFFFAMLAPIILFGCTVWIDWRVAVVLIFCVPLIPISIAAVAQFAKKIFIKYWGKYTSMGDEFLDSIQGMNELKIFRTDQAKRERMNKSADDFRKITMKVLTMQLMSTTIMDLIAYGGAGVGIAIALWDVTHRGVLPAEGLFLILTAVEFFLPLRAFGAAFHVAMNGVSAGTKIMTLLSKPLPKWGDIQASPGDIEIKDVTYSYDGKRDVLKNVSMSFPSRGITAIVGESGCGKTTIVNLLLGFCHANKGEVALADTNISDLDRESYYGLTAVVNYNTYIFNLSVRDNFKMANRDISDDDIYHALKKVNLDVFIKQNGGLNQLIAENAANFSGGQKQRLALAVSLVADKKIYIFDEATSNIDSESEEIIMRTIKELANSKCVIIISHRLENVIDAHNIYFMKDGRVIEHGTHNALISAQMGYSTLYNVQKNMEKGACA